MTCFNKYLATINMKKKQFIANWQDYIINLSMPFRKGKIEGDDFAIQWLCEMLHVNIYIWTTKTRSISATFHSSNASQETVYLMQSLVNESHRHFYPLLPIHSSNSSLPCPLPSMHSTNNYLLASCYKTKPTTSSKKTSKITMPLGPVHD